MKNPTLTRVFFLQQRSTELCQEFLTVLQKEKLALISLKTDDILQLIVEKEHRLLLVKKIREELQLLLQANFAVDSSDEFEKLLNEPEKSEWGTLRKAWLTVWESSVQQIESNQKFMNHSLKNLSSLVENL